MKSFVFIRIAFSLFSLWDLETMWSLFYYEAVFVGSTQLSLKSYNGTIKKKKAEVP
jgi:hypothetical protein